MKACGISTRLVCIGMFIAALLSQGCGRVNPKNFAEGLRVMTGRGGTAEKIDTFPAITTQANQIAKAYPAPVWQKTYKADTADIFELLPGNMKFRPPCAALMIPSSIASKGHRSMRFDRARQHERQSPIFVHNSKVYFSTYKTLTILDEKTGARLDKLAFSFLESGLFSALAPDIFLARNGNVIMLRAGGAVYALSGKTNQLLWKQVVNWSYEMFFNTTQINNELKKTLTDKAHAEQQTKDSAQWWKNWTSAVDHQWRGYDSRAQLGRSGSMMVLSQSILGSIDSLQC